MIAFLILYPLHICVRRSIGYRMLFGAQKPRKSQQIAPNATQWNAILSLQFLCVIGPGRPLRPAYYFQRSEDYRFSNRVEVDYGFTQASSIGLYTCTSVCIYIYTYIHNGNVVSIVLSVDLTDIVYHERYRYVSTCDIS